MNRHRIVVAGLVALALISGSGGALAQRRKKGPENQPVMERALSSLRDAQKALTNADTGKGGHRKKALELVNQAIEQVEKGIAFDNKNPDK